MHEVVWLVASRTFRISMSPEHGRWLPIMGDLHSNRGMKLPEYLRTPGILTVDRIGDSCVHKQVIALVFVLVKRSI